MTAIQDMACVGGAEWSNYCPQGCSANECESQPCANDGLCFDGEGEYLCICTEGYRGENCELDAFVCAAGSYVTPGTEICTPCEAGSADTDYNPATPCAACGAGEGSDAGATECVACELSLIHI